MGEAKSDFSKLASKIWECEEEKETLKVELKKKEALLEEANKKIELLEQKLKEKEKELTKIHELEELLEKQKQETRKEREEIIRKHQALIDSLKTELDKKNRELMEEKDKGLLQFIITRYIRPK